MSTRLIAEIWEIQTILYFILTVLLFTLTDLKGLAWGLLVWSIISMVGTFWKLWQAVREELDG